MKICVVIMAGGVGSRFWPQSRERRPKQLLEVVTKGRSLVQATVDRVGLFADLQDVLIVTNDAQREELERQVPSISPANILSEPLGRNTATCIALAVKVLRERHGDDAVMIVLPADHVVKNQ